MHSYKIPWPDNLAILVAISVQGRDERGRMMRRTLLRYINLALAFTFTLVSSQGKARFPKMDRFVEIGKPNTYMRKLTLFPIS